MKKIIRKCLNILSYVLLFTTDIGRVERLIRELDFNVIKGKNSEFAKDIITYNLKLPEFYNGILIDWKSTIPSINCAGIIIQNESCEGEIIATARSKFFTKTKTFKIRTQKQSDEERVGKALNGLTFDTICGLNSDEKNIKSDLVLPLVAENGARIVWETNDFCKDGKIIRGNKDAENKIKATVYSGNCTGTKEFDIIIKAKPSFVKQKVLVLVPHGDDEMLLAASIMYREIKRENEVFVCFYAHNDCNTTDRKDTSNGKEYASHRHKESIDALGYFGIPKENIYTLGYGNGQANNHIYDNKTDVCNSRAGFTQTYGTEYLTDYHTLKHGKPAEYTHKNVVNDIYEFIVDLKPDVIFVNDLDMQYDHRALSLFFDEAMGKILKEQETYKPKVYKGFAYCTSGYTKDDFLKYDSLMPTVKPQKYKLKSCGETDNPMFLWKDRICFATEEELQEQNYIRNPAIQALLRYGRLYNVVNRFINADSVFWERRTDSLTYNADIEVSSGNGNGICDFKIIDCKKVSENEPDYSAGLWTPNDSEKVVKITFESPVSVALVKIYQNTFPKDRIIKGTLQFSDGSFVDVDMGKDVCKEIVFPQKSNIEWLSFKILKTKGKNFGVSEIEVFSNAIEKHKKVETKKKYKKVNNRQWLYVYNKQYRV